MRFLLLNQFYPPDPAPTGTYLRDLARTLARRGHVVRVLCSRRSYDGKNEFLRRETVDGVEVRRLSATGFGRRSFLGKMADYATFYFSLFAALMLEGKRPDLILSLTTPPYVGLLGKIAAWRHRCRHAHWIMDVYPDVMFAHGMTRNDRVLYRLLQRMTRFQLRGAQSVLSLGPMMAERVAAYATGQRSEVRGQKTEVRGQRSEVSSDLRSPTSDLCSQSSRLTWMPLWSDSELAPLPADESNSLRDERGWPRNDTIFLYSGNMGLGHRFGEFLEAAKRFGPSGPRWVFSGGGKRRAEIEAFAKSNPHARIELLDYVPQARLGAHLCSADVHLASLDAAWQGLIVPSKLQGSFAVGRPVLYVGGRNCETAAWILESGGGWVVQENDVEGVIGAIQEALNVDERRKRGEAALQFARKRFEMPTTCASIAQLLEGVSASDIRPLTAGSPASGDSARWSEPLRM